MAANVSGGGGGSRAAVAVEACREHLAAGRLPQAAHQLGQALFHDPALASAYAAVGEVAEAAGSASAACELFKGDGTTVFSGNGAAIVALLAAEGQTSDAIELLGALAAARPEKSWAAAPWFSPQLAASLPLLSLGKAVTAVWQAVGNPAPPETVGPLAPWLALARQAAARPEAGADLLCALSALARRLGAYEEAIAWCDAAAKAETAEGRATQPTLIMLGYAYRDGGQPGRAIDAWTRAAALPPANADLLLDLADITHDQGDFVQSLDWAERAAAADPSGSKARAALLAARYRTGRQAQDGGDASQLTALIDLALAHPKVPYLRRCVSRACEGATWLQAVPPPTEAVARIFGHLAGIEESGEGRVTGVTSHATALEAPTPTALLRARFPRFTMTVPEPGPSGQVPGSSGQVPGPSGQVPGPSGQVPGSVHTPGPGPSASGSGPSGQGTGPSAPDPRVPVSTEYGPPLWTYRGTEATATVARPSAEAVALVHRVAAGMWADPLVAFERAAAFASLSSADLLGLLAHVPPPRGPSWADVQRAYPLYWQRSAQVWVSLGILHHRAAEPWQRSARRTLLLRLLFGPEDWTVDAAAFALCVAAWHDPDPEHRTEIADAVARRYRHAAEAVGRRPTELHDPLARIVLIYPGIDPGTTRLARQNLAAREEEAAADAPHRQSGSLLRRWRHRK